MNNLLVNSLPIGECKNRSFKSAKLITLPNNIDINKSYHLCEENIVFDESLGEIPGL